MANGLWVVLNVASIEKSVEFYKGLGLRASTQKQGPMRWGIVDAKDSGIILWDKNELGPDQPAQETAVTVGRVRSDGRELREPGRSTAGDVGHPENPQERRRRQLLSHAVLEDARESRDRHHREERTP